MNTDGFYQQPHSKNPSCTKIPVMQLLCALEKPHSLLAAEAFKIYNIKQLAFECRLLHFKTLLLFDVYLFKRVYCS